ncbi:MAG: hypothetical protein H7331_01310 [Bacteroidia bacterium]|nr:hypothetical protein [Bacteroidia bacterium]
MEINFKIFFLLFSEVFLSNQSLYFAFEENKNAVIHVNEVKYYDKSKTKNTKIITVTDSFITVINKKSKYVVMLNSTCSNINIKEYAKEKLLYDGEIIFNLSKEGEMFNYKILTTNLGIRRDSLSYNNKDSTLLIFDKGKLLRKVIFKNNFEQLICYDYSNDLTNFNSEIIDYQNITKEKFKKGYKITETNINNIEFIGEEIKPLKRITKISKVK